MTLTVIFTLTVNFTSSECVDTVFDAFYCAITVTSVSLIWCSKFFYHFQLQFQCIGEFFFYFSSWLFKTLINSAIVKILIFSKFSQETTHPNAITLSRVQFVVSLTDGRDGTRKIRAVTHITLSPLTMTSQIPMEDTVFSNVFYENLRKVMFATSCRVVTN